MSIAFYRNTKQSIMNVCVGARQEEACMSSTDISIENAVRTNIQSHGCKQKFKLIFTENKQLKN